MKKLSDNIPTGFELRLEGNVKNFRQCKTKITRLQLSPKIFLSREHMEQTIIFRQHINDVILYQSPAG